MVCDGWKVKEEVGRGESISGGMESGLEKIVVEYQLDSPDRSGVPAKSTVCDGWKVERRVCVVRRQELVESNHNRRKLGWMRRIGVGNLQQAHMKRELESV